MHPRQRGRDFGLLATTSLLLVASFFGIAPPTVAAGPSDTSVRAAQAFRDRAGLRSDWQYVAASFESDRFSDAAWGYPLSTDELADLQTRLDNRPKYQAAIDWALTQDDTAGVFIDQQDHGYAHFLFTTDLSGNTRQLEALIPDDAPFRVQLAAVSLSQLRALADKVSDGISEDQAMGLPVVMVAVSVIDNSVLVSVARDRNEVAQKLRARFGDNLTFRTTGDVHEDTCSSRRDCGDPLKGALWIRDRTNAAHYPCTSGFWARLSGGAHRLITAGHCVNPDFVSPENPDVWHHPVPTPLPDTIPSSYNMGTAVGETYHAVYNGVAAQVDIGWIDPTTAQDVGPFNQVFGSGTSDIRDIVYRAPNNEQLVGDRVCRSTTHGSPPPKYVCDFISFNFVAGQPVDGHKVRNLNEVPIDAYCGDSGAPYMQSRSVGTSVIWGAAGTHSDSSDNGPPNDCGDSVCDPADCFSLYNTVDTIENNSPLTICTSATC